jgi:hypothetical protein
VIAPESMRAFWTPTSSGQVIMTFEWITSGGSPCRWSHHYARSIRVMRHFDGFIFPVNLVDDFGGSSFLRRGLVEARLTYTRPNEFFAELIDYGVEPPQLNKRLAVLSMTQDDALGSCRSKILRQDTSYVTDHFCDIEEMRRIAEHGGTPTRTREIFA